MTSKSSRCLTCTPHGGVDNPNWKGGKSRHKAGYVTVNVGGKGKHPRTTTSYVFEHILVMEAHLGRYLTKGENVHHKNGVKDDNRLENLELWVSNQPSGQRAEDLVSWAKEILEKYEKCVDTPKKVCYS